MSYESCSFSVSVVHDTPLSVTPCTITITGLFGAGAAR
jgi:hypothetical protein